MNKFARFVFLAMVILFCWGWVSNVALGRMTTGQYIRKIGMDFQRVISNGSGKILNTKDRITRNSDTLYRSVT